jgi:hypothetical protein
VLVYLAIYVVTSLVGFVAILMLRDANDKPVEAIADLAGLSRSKPGLAFVLAMVMFSLAGIPPLFGFWGKFVVFQAAVAAGYTTIATIAVLGSVPAAFYYLKVVKVILRRTRRQGGRQGRCSAHQPALCGRHRHLAGGLSGHRLAGRLCGHGGGCAVPRGVRQAKLIEVLPLTGSTNADLAARLSAGKPRAKATGWWQTGSRPGGAPWPRVERRCGQFHGLHRGVARA